jgi:hypothetical protein
MDETENTADPMNFKLQKRSFIHTPVGGKETSTSCQYGLTWYYHGSYLEWL